MGSIESVKGKWEGLVGMTGLVRVGLIEVWLDSRSFVALLVTSGNRVRASMEETCPALNPRATL